MKNSFRNIIGVLVLGAAFLFPLTIAIAQEDGDMPPPGSMPDAPQAPGGGHGDGFSLLAPIPGREGLTGSPDLASYLSGAYALTVGLAGVLAVLMIVIGGIEYIFSAVPSAKADAKRRITGAIFGLILALTSYILLRTLNPDLLTVGLNLPFLGGAVLEEGGGGSGGPPSYDSYYLIRIIDGVHQEDWIREEGVCQSNLNACNMAPGCELPDGHTGCIFTPGTGGGQANPPDQGQADPVPTDGLAPPPPPPPPAT